MYPCKLKPAIKDYIWGGNRLKTEFAIDSDKMILAEAWMLSCNMAGSSVIAHGAQAGKPLAEALFGELESDLGTNSAFATYFPILIKLIDAQKDLSIQVHPGDAYAFIHEGGFGKTEMWYVLDAKADAFLYYGFSRPVSPEELRSRIENNTLTDVLNAVPVKKGDVFFIEAGTIHAIGAGILIAEIQQNSDTTYRVYDYGRTDESGKQRELHIEKALAVIDTSFVPGERIQPPILQKDGYCTSRLAHCPYFTVDLIEVDSFADLETRATSFVSLLVIEGNGRILFANNEFGNSGFMDITQGESVFLPAKTGKYRIEGACRVLLSTK